MHRGYTVDMNTVDVNTVAVNTLDVSGKTGNPRGQPHLVARLVCA
jgi:hypothetical protein